MTTPAGTIDLGELAPGPPSEPDAPWPVLVRLRRWHSPRRAIRLAGLAAATVLALLAVAAAPPQPVFTLHLTLPAVLDFTQDQQNLYAVEVPETGQSRVTAYRLADRTLRWAAPLPASDFAWLELQNGVLLVQSFGSTGSHATGFDSDTGRELWRRAGAYEHALSSEFRLFSDSGPDSPDVVVGPPRHELAALDLSTGQPEWTVSVTGGSYVTGGPDSPYLVVANDAEDEIVSYDLATGERLARAAVPGADSLGIQVVGSLVLSVDQGRRPPTVTGYDVTTLAPRWTTADRSDLNTWAVSCGDLVCLVGAEPPRALDPASGELVWSVDWLPSVGDEGTYWVSEPEAADLAGRLLVTDQTGSHSWLVDARTGTLVLDLRDWLLPGRPQPAAGTERPLLFRADSERILVGQLRPDRSGIRALGAIGVTPPATCDAGTGYVVCLAESGSSEQPRELTVWRHRLR